MAKQVALTTIDNPFDYFDEFDQWLAFDLAKGYKTLSLLGRLSFSSGQTSESSDAFSLEMTIDDIIKADVVGIYRKIERESD